MNCKELLINAKKTGVQHPVFMIAEAGSNHNGSIDKAKELIDIASDSGADAIKFQNYIADKIVAASNPAYDVLKKNELPASWLEELLSYAQEKGLAFISTPFDLEAVNTLKNLGVHAFKIASGDITYKQLLERVGEFGLPVILSTGKSNLGEIEYALKTLANEQLIILHCVSSYPASYEEMNLKVLQTLQHAFPGYQVGLSDHTLDDICALGAVALGASVIEKHITYDKAADGPDHSFAMEPEQFSGYVAKIRNLEQAIGNGVKGPSKKEQETLNRGRRSIYAAEDIGKGTIISEKHLKIVRPGEGLMPKHLDEIIGLEVLVDVVQDEPIKWNQLRLKA